MAPLGVGWCERGVNTNQITPPALSAGGCAVNLNDLNTDTRGVRVIVDVHTRAEGQPPVHWRARTYVTTRGPASGRPTHLRTTHTSGPPLEDVLKRWPWGVGRGSACSCQVWRASDVGCIRATKLSVSPKQPSKALPAVAACTSARCAGTRRRPKWGTQLGTLILPHQ